MSEEESEHEANGADAYLEDGGLEDDAAANNQQLMEVDGGLRAPRDSIAG